MGRNYAIAQAAHELIAITDAGCEPRSQWLKFLENKVEASVNKRNVVVAGYYEAIPTTNFETAVVPYFLVMADRVNPANFLPATRSMMLHRAVWEKVGRFDETLSDNEDYEFARRLKKYERTNSKKILYFTNQAIVKWEPPNSLSQFAQTIFRFARGDVQSKIFRPKVLLIFSRYLVGIIITMILIFLNWFWLLGAFLLVSGVSYSTWAVLKNYRYAPQGWYWLPVLQVISDLAVMAGSIEGLDLST